MNSIHRRITPLGRWTPVVFYLLTVLSWFIEGMRAGAELWLVFWTLPALGLYLWRTRPRSS
ncbi:hypothetical protein Nhal_2725 [Nitrosococcus halophilus Nc 4]|uniref:Uncharacterized protein n=1 Tax=Nitrosococcus halophilus (strain Nc4) TaxID=472759 RepID=D5BXB5_NITHN|nr:hypothetical protein [Nitrosococcus halophilus]ADE15798.1 hypothetical protein Nhal_2725 [Nitrosococcus halophilus Nc 4]